MGISSAVNISLSGLQLNQRELDLIAGNIANADTVGYTRKTLVTENRAQTDGSSIGVREVTVQRAYDAYLAAQYRAGLTQAGGLNVMASYQQRLDQMYGQPGDVNALDTLYNDFTASLEALGTTPEDYATRSKVIADAQALAARLNTMSAEVQDMRAEAEQSISERVDYINQLLGDLTDINAEIISFSSTGRSPAALLDDRDQIVNQLSQMMDIRVSEGDRNELRIFTNNGTLLFDGNPAVLSFDAAGTVAAGTVWSADPAERDLGTITLTSVNGHAIDLIAQNTFRSGELAAYIELRDDVLVEAQNQLDEMAHALSLALSNRTETGTAASVGPQNGFDVDLTGLQPGNSITLDYVDVGSGESRRVTIFRVDDPTLLPLDDSVTADPNDTVLGIDFSAGLTAAAADIGAALGAGFTVSDEGGNVLRILDDGGATTTASALSASITNTSLVDQGVEIPFFVDGASGWTTYTGDFEGVSQKTGYAGRIAVNNALITDPSRLVVYETSPQTASGDSTRPLYMLERLDSATYQFSADTGLGSANSPYSGSVSGYLRQVINHRGSEMETATRAAEAQTIVVNSLTERVDAATKVSVDDELGRLIELQSAYAANARVLEAAREMIDSLMRI